MDCHPAPGIPYDDLPAPTQALVREWWDQEIERSIANLNLREIFEREGQAYVSVEPDGRLVIVPGASGLPQLP